MTTDHEEGISRPATSPWKSMTTQPNPRPQSGPPPQPLPDTSASGARSWTMWEKALGITTAIISLVAAVLGLQKEQAQASAEKTGEDLSALQRRYDQLELENGELRSEIARLTDDPEPPRPTAPPEPAVGPTVRHQGLLTLARNGDGADLDSPASNPQWNTGDTEILINGATGGLQVSGDAALLFLGGTQANYDSCRGTPGYRGRGLLRDEIAEGDYFCIKTRGKRYSALRITAATSDEVSFDVVTYDPPEA